MTVALALLFRPTIMYKRNKHRRNLDDLSSKRLPDHVEFQCFPIQSTHSSHD